MYVNLIEDALGEDEFLSTLSKLRSIEEIKRAFESKGVSNVSEEDIKELYSTAFVMFGSDGFHIHLDDCDLEQVSGGNPTTTSSKWGINTLVRLKDAIQASDKE